MLKHLYLLDPDAVYLNHGSFGACPVPVFERYQDWQRRLERQPMELLGRQFRSLLRDARASLAAFLGASPEDLVFVPNATSGINTVALSLPLRPGDEVLTTEHEYGGVDRCWRYLCERRGARYVVHEGAPDTLWSRVTERTRVIAMSHITSPTAILLPVEEIVSRAREVGIWTIIDGAHAPGQLDLDLDAVGADFYAGNCHKWLSAPKGAGFLHVRRELQDLVQPLIVSWGWKANDEWQGDTPFITRLEWQGTHDISAWLSVAAAIEFRRAQDWTRVQAHCRDVLDYAIERLSHPVLQPHAPNMAAFVLPTCDVRELQRRLREDFNIEIPVNNQWRNHCLVRVSAAPYNDRTDIDRLIEALHALVPDLT